MTMFIVHPATDALIACPMTALHRNPEPYLTTRPLTFEHDEVILDPERPSLDPHGYKHIVPEGFIGFYAGPAMGVKAAVILLFVDRKNIQQV